MNYNSTECKINQKRNRIVEISCGECRIEMKRRNYTRLAEGEEGKVWTLAAGNSWVNQRMFSSWNAWGSIKCSTFTTFSRSGGGFTGARYPNWTIAKAEASGINTSTSVASAVASGHSSVRNFNQRPDERRVDKVVNAESADGVVGPELLCEDTPEPCLINATDIVWRKSNPRSLLVARRSWRATRGFNPFFWSKN